MIKGLSVLFLIFFVQKEGGKYFNSYRQDVFTPHKLASLYTGY
jgi:hypothetical protein